MSVRAFLTRSRAVAPANAEDRLRAIRTGPSVVEPRRDVLTAKPGVMGFALWRNRSAPRWLAALFTVGL
jgi:hypothetical protein